MALASGILGRIRWDDFQWVPVREHEGQRVVLNEHEMVRLMCDLQALGFERVAEQTLRNVVHLVGRDDPCDSGQDWLLSLSPWDGVGRIEKFLHSYLGTPDDAYHTAVGLYMWTGLVARLQEPGCKADMVVVLVGAQGMYKSTALKIIAGPPEHLGEIALTERSNRMFRKCIAKTVVVWEEVRGIRGKSDADEVKTRITSQIIEMDDKDGFGMREYQRRFLIFGTSNRTDFLRDVTGHRRYLPFTVVKVDLERLAADLDQLWAEAAVIYQQRRAAGLSSVAYEDAERLAVDVHPHYERATRWGDCETLIEWIDGSRPPFKTADALWEVGINKGNSSNYWQDERDMVATLKQLGCWQYRPTVAGRSGWMWHAPDHVRGQHSLFHAHHNRQRGRRVR